MSIDSPVEDARPVVRTPDLRFERRAVRRGATVVAGVDEAGRGPLAGPVVTAAVILNTRRMPRGLDDSKKLTADDLAGANRALMASLSGATRLADAGAAKAAE